MRVGRAGGAVLAVGLALAATSSTLVVGANPNVLLVGPAGTSGAQYTSIQDAVNHAQPGDWVLVWPGVYHEKGSDGPNASLSAGVLITKPDLHLRGMDRHKVIVDGTNPAGTQPYTGLSGACPSSEAAQDTGPVIAGNHIGRNGIEAYKASGVYIENLTVCNYLSVSGAHTGNEIWWNAGDGSDTQTPMTAWGSHLTATTTYYKDGSSPLPSYGIFTSNTGADNSRGPSLIEWTYANNMADSDYYVGACPDCNVVIRHAHAQNAALGYSGTNGSGRVTIEKSEWDNLHAGIVPSTLNNDDAPSPQDGKCPSGITSPEVAAPSNICFLIRDNYIHDNNNPDNPGAGIASVAPVGTGIELVAGRNDAVVHNVITNNGSWGIVFHDYPDSETYPANLPQGDACRGGTGNASFCSYPNGNNYALANTLSGNGGNGNATNGDLMNEQLPADLVSPGPNCFQGNLDPANTNSAPSEYPAGLQEGDANCPPVGVTEPALSAIALICASGIISSTTGQDLGCSTFEQAAGTKQFTYPKPDLSKCATAVPGSVAMPNADSRTGACMITLDNTIARASQQPAMKPCAGVPANPWCPGLPKSGEQLPFSAPSVGESGPTPAALLVAGIGTLVLALRTRQRRRTAR